MRNLRATLTEPGAAQRVFDKVFKLDVERLLSMDEMWKNRKRPTAISYEEASLTAHDNNASVSLRDQTQLGLRETVELFEQSLNALAKRSLSSTEPLSFDKDDDDALDFVTASSNLRSRVYSIETKTRFDIKQMAGNIIPAIASTNAIISGALVLQSLHMLQRTWSKARDVMLGKSARFILSGTEAAKPNPACGVCADVYVPVQVSDPAVITLGQLIEQAKLSQEQGGLGLGEDLELGVYEGSRLLADPDFDDNHDKSLSSLGIEYGKFLALVDEDGIKATVQLIVTSSSSSSVSGDEGRQEVRFPQADSLPLLKDRPVPPKPAEESDAEDDDDVRALDSKDDTGDAEFVIDDAKDAAQRHVAAAAAAATTKGPAPGASPATDRKRRRAEEATLLENGHSDNHQTNGGGPGSIVVLDDEHDDTAAAAAAKKRRTDDQV